MIYAVNYDLRKPGQNYVDLHDAIKGCGRVVALSRLHLAHRYVHECRGRLAKARALR